jgi:23S rRNA G2069 N7-methylase RlmK/C1962 C5-methylase RlmI
VQSSAYWVEANKHAVQRAVSGCLEPGQRMVWRRAETRLKQDGWDEAVGEGQGQDVTDQTLEGASDVNLAALSVCENGVVYEVNAQDGQKTGFYCDQRDNRAMLRRMVYGKRVLDAYCYTGGFTLNCLLGGATHVTAIDSSNPALQVQLTLIALVLIRMTPHPNSYPLPPLHLLTHTVLCAARHRNRTD